MTSLGRLPRSSAATPPLEDDDLLFEILLLLPPEPSSLPRASVVCKRWHRVVTDPHFICRFRRHHRRKPPLLGFFNTDRGRISFQPIMEAPNRVPPERFSLQVDDGDGFKLLGCRHGLVLFLAYKRKQVLVWDPVTGDQHSVAVPTGFYMNITNIQGAVLCAAGEIHNFQVVLVAAREDDEQHRQVLASVYSSQAGVWGNPISAPVPPEAYTGDYFTSICVPDVLVGDSLYWALDENFASSSYILEFNLERQGLAVIELPVDMSEDDGDLTAMGAEGGGLGFLFVSEADASAQLWKRKTDCDGVASWAVARTIQLDKLLSLNSEEERQFLVFSGFAECNNVAFFKTRAVSAPWFPWASLPCWLGILFTGLLLGILLPFLSLIWRDRA
ncbi:hypothetical protein QYE76_019688 [Lolium multiflorum]|uniref:F-box domain-containing protein n=1 Tax=Lolium multiflorum TaxID=4521 RepID=A0AAD8VQM4_LOLMU|nr:hypothetical protein QYE76_019683 [Lolium multiflorum]KAK1614171.1 hypothetical protein QYE76_019688 [Lolium multiflorum]